ncbi:MAG: isopentenyl phosphate kinase [Thermoplasmata archaeon]
MILIKLGGSVITNKEIKYSFEEDVTRRLADEIKESVNEDIIIVHGGGSYGHPGAEHFKLNTTSPIEIDRGTAEVQNDMRKLNDKIMDVLISLGIWAVSLPGGVVSRYKGGELASIDKDIFSSHIDLGLTPVTFGDVALDSEYGVTICSGDDLMAALSPMAEKAVFITDVDGVYKNGKILKTMKQDMLPLAPGDIPAGKDSIDVTGGMNAKVEKMAEIAGNCRTYIVNGKVPGRVEKLLKGEDIICTEVIR